VLVCRRVTLIFSEEDPDQGKSASVFWRFEVQKHVFPLTLLERLASREKVASEDPGASFRRDPESKPSIAEFISATEPAQNMRIYNHSPDLSS
jgi:hypothetical protein